MSDRVRQVRRRAAASRGASSEHLYARARDLLLARGARGHVADVGCGRGALRASLDGIATRYIGLDAMRYEGFPRDADFIETDFDGGPLPLADRSVDVAVGLEVIEHVENPRGFVRELARITRAHGTILLSTPNQLSALSLLSLLARGEFNAFQGADYPAHITALLPVDLRRIAAECGLDAVEIAWSNRGRLPLTARHAPDWISRLLPCRFSDHVLLFARVRP